MSSPAQLSVELRSRPKKSRSPVESESPLSFSLNSAIPRCCPLDRGIDGGQKAATRKLPAKDLRALLRFMVLGGCDEGANAKRLALLEELTFREMPFVALDREERVVRATVHECALRRIDELAFEAQIRRFRRGVRRCGGRLDPEFR